MAFDCLFGQRRHPCRDLAINRNISNPDFHRRSNQCACLTRVAIQKTFAFERRNVLHHRCLACKTEMTLDFARARGDTFLALLALNEIENVSLALG